MSKKPFVHSERNAAQYVRFNDEQVVIGLADGRTLLMPLYFFPWLQSAPAFQRERYELNGLTVYWEELDEGIDLIAMLTGLYTSPKPVPEAVRLALS